ncbi:MAG: hypothetical protein WCC87_18570 [Candidatus Korobacteraceae bacterium]
MRTGNSQPGQLAELDQLSGSLRIAFVSGHSRWWRKQRLVAKYFKMRLEGLIYPDVYCLALMLSGRFDFLLEDEKVAPGKYDVIFAELQSSDTQLRYLESLVEAQAPPVIVVPGPPAILSRDLTDPKLRRVQRILSGARGVWAYSPELKTFCDGLIGRDRATLIPWPYDLAATQKLGRVSPPSSGSRKILLQAPMSFHDIVQNHPFILKALLLDLWPELPTGLRDQLSFHTFVYNSTDVQRYHSSGFAAGLPFTLESKLAYRPFVRFLAGCDGIVNLTAGSILGRITFLSAALARPGIFSDNSPLNARLYPGSTVAMFDTVHLRELLRAMLLGLPDGAPDPRLLPSSEAVADIGNFAANQTRLHQILAADLDTP